MTKYRATFWASVALLSCLFSVAWLSARWPGYRQSLHPLALLGANGVRDAVVFNVGAFLLPGTIALGMGASLRAALPRNAGWAARIGAWLTAIAGIAFAGQGALPIDPSDLEGMSTRLHALVWTLWWTAFVPGALSLSIGLGRLKAWLTMRMRVLTVSSAIAGAAMFVLVALPLPELPAGLGQRLAYTAWFVWLIVCGLGIDDLHTFNRVEALAAKSIQPRQK